MAFQNHEEEDTRKDLDARLPVDVPLGRYVGPAVDEHNRHWGEDPIRWESDLFYFVRLLKRHPELARATAEQAFKKVGKVMSAWRDHQKDPDADPWLSWLHLAPADAHAEFVDGWDKARYLPGHTPLEAAAERARRQPLKVPAGSVRAWAREYEQFLSVADWLQVTMGDRPILLPVEDLGILLGVQKITVSRYRKWAQADGLLKEVAASTYDQKTRCGRATEFYFDVGQFPILKEAAQTGTQASYDGAP